MVRHVTLCPPCGCLSCPAVPGPWIPSESNSISASNASTPTPTGPSPGSLSPSCSERKVCTPGVTVVDRPLHSARVSADPSPDRLLFDSSQPPNICRPKLWGTHWLRFVRTTFPKHHDALLTFWGLLEASGSLYSGTYSGWYSSADESFLDDSEVVDGHSTVTGAAVGRVVKEPTIYFALSRYQEQLVALHSRTSPAFVDPPCRSRELLTSLKTNPLQDVSVTRFVPNEDLTNGNYPGVSVPHNRNLKIYVWLDALVGYLTAVGFPDTDGVRFREMWPPDMQILGKDISRFHAVLWPALLMAAGLPSPKKLIIHGWWLRGGRKISKRQSVPPKLNHGRDETLTTADSLVANALAHGQKGPDLPIRKLGTSGDNETSKVVTQERDSRRTEEGATFSGSHIVCPVCLSKAGGTCVDVLRFHLLHEMALDQDVSFRVENLRATGHRLANTLGNLLLRLHALLQRATGGTAPRALRRADVTRHGTPTLTGKLLLGLQDALDGSRHALCNSVVQPAQYPRMIMKVADEANRYLDLVAPWKIIPKHATQNQLGGEYSHSPQQMQQQQKQQEHIQQQMQQQEQKEQKVASTDTPTPLQRQHQLAGTHSVQLNAVPYVSTATSRDAVRHADSSGVEVAAGLPVGLKSSTSSYQCNTGTLLAESVGDLCDESSSSPLVCLRALTDSICVLGVLALPLLPHSASYILDSLSVPVDVRNFASVMETVKQWKLQILHSQSAKSAFKECTNQTQGPYSSVDSLAMGGSYHNCNDENDAVDDTLSTLVPPGTRMKSKVQPLFLKHKELE
eukprot:GHVT01098082.1.p1 GENE.GHVT01098082.1~~GHVT01098082.1.p1  ORF type:complete len:934 (+),score=85.70 GHVT01098082.1:420-2804(+)